MKMPKGIKTYWICDGCAAVNGGKWPEGHIATVTHRVCENCNGKLQTHGEVAPYVDYDWPDKEVTKQCKLNRD